MWREAFPEVLSFFLAFLLALYATPLCRRAALEFGIVDRPDGRLKQHREPVPYLGGLAIYLAFLLSLAFTFHFSQEVLGLLLAGTIVVLVGLVDDFGVLSPGVKLAGEAVAVLVLLKSGIHMKLQFLPEAVNLALSVVWLLAVTNAFNLIDVMDGLSSGVAFIAALVLAAVAMLNGRETIAVLTLALAGSLLGFLKYNLAPARIYMGDAGSLFIGLVLGALAMIGSYSAKNDLAVVVPALILGVPLFDMLFVSYVRWLRGHSPLRGSNDHIALRLRQWRLSIRQTVAVNYATTLGLGLFGLVLMQVTFATAVALLAGLLLSALGVGAWLRTIEMAR